MSDKLCKKCGIQYNPITERDTLNFGKCVKCRIEQALEECRRFQMIWTPRLQEEYR